MYMTYHKDNHRFNNSYHNYQDLCSISHTIQTRNLKFSLQKLRVFFENYCFQHFISKSSWEVTSPVGKLVHFTCYPFSIVIFTIFFVVFFYSLVMIIIVVHSEHEKVRARRE